jgi:hypothetical protein
MQAFHSFTSHRMFRLDAARGLALLALFSFLAATARADLVEAVAKIVSVRGTATDGVGNALKTGDILKTADTIRTGADSFADVVLQGKGIATAVLRVGASSELNLTRLSQFNFDDGPDRLNPYASVELNLKAGSVLANVRKNNPGKFEVKTPTSVAGIRGTAFRLSSTGSILVVEGRVLSSVILPNGRTVSLPLSVGQRLNVTPQLVDALSRGDLTEDDLRFLVTRDRDGIVTAWQDLSNSSDLARAGAAEVPLMISRLELERLLSGAATTASEARKGQRRGGPSAAGSPPSPPSPAPSPPSPASSP